MNQFFVFFAACLKDETESVNQQYISQHLSDGDADDRNHDVGSRQSQNDGDGTSQQGQEGEEPHPGSSVGHEMLSLVKTLFLYMQIFLYPFQLAHPSYAIVEHRTEHIADASIQYELDRFQSGSL